MLDEHHVPHRVASWDEKFRIYNYVEWAAAESTSMQRFNGKNVDEVAAPAKLSLIGQANLKQARTAQRPINVPRPSGTIISNGNG